MNQSDLARAANRARFARLVAKPEPEIDLALGALLIAADGRPEVEPEPTVAALDELADRTRLRLDRDDPPTALARLHDVLYVERGLRGPSSAEYHDPDNSRLDRVMERRIGLPISLAIVELEVGWRHGLELVGIGLPGHFIVGGPGGVLVDPAGAGRSLTRDDCQALIQRALGVIELLSVVEPTDPDHRRDRGLLLGRMGRFSDALVELRGYLDERPEGHDARQVRQVMSTFGGRRN